MLWLCWAHGHAAWHAFDLLQSINQSIQSIQLISVAASNSSWACAALIMTSTAILPEVSHGL